MFTWKFNIFCFFNILIHYMVSFINNIFHIDLRKFILVQWVILINDIFIESLHDLVEFLDTKIKDLSMHYTFKHAS